MGKVELIILILLYGAMSMTKNVATTIKNNNISDAWYGDSEWHDLLKHYVGGDHINITEALSSTEQLNHYLQQLVQQPNTATTESVKSEHIIPLNVIALTGKFGANNNHWVGLHIVVNSNNNSVTVKYIDPMGRVISNQIQSTIKQQLEKSFAAVDIEQPLLDNGIQYVRQVSKLELSGNIDDCGPMLIYALTCSTRVVDLIKISDRVGSVSVSLSLGNFLRSSFKKKTDFNEIHDAWLNGFAYRKLDDVFDGSFPEGVIERTNDLYQVGYDMNLINILIKDLRTTYLESDVNKSGTDIKLLNTLNNIEIFSKYLIDTIKELSCQNTTIILPLLLKNHFYSCVIEIQQKQNSDDVRCVINNPYGIAHNDQILKKVQQQISKFAEEITAKPVKLSYLRNFIDLQGYGSDFTNCGPISVYCIERYLINAITNCDLEENHTVLNFDEFGKEGLDQKLHDAFMLRLKLQHINIAIAPNKNKEKDFVLAFRDTAEPNAERTKELIKQMPALTNKVVDLSCKQYSKFHKFFKKDISGQEEFFEKLTLPDQLKLLTRISESIIKDANPALTNPSPLSETLDRIINVFIEKDYPPHTGKTMNKLFYEFWMKFQQDEGIKSYYEDVKSYKEQLLDKYKMLFAEGNINLQKTRLKLESDFVQNATKIFYHVLHNWTTLTNKFYPEEIKKVEILEYLLENGADPFYHFVEYSAYTLCNGSAAYEVACKNKDFAEIIFRYFPEKIDAILLSAIESKNNEIVSGVLSRKDIVISKETIEKGLEIAHKKEKEISESLDHTKKLYSGCFVPLYGNNDESYRLDKQKLKNITECLTNKIENAPIKINYQGKKNPHTELVEAAKSGDLEKVKKLIDSGTIKNVDMLDETGINALLAATQNKHIEVAKYLLVNGARTDIYSKQFLELVISFSNENFLYDIIQEDILVATFIIAYVMNLAPNLAKNLVEPYSDVFKSLGQRGYKVLLQVGDQALKKGKCVEAEYCYKQVQKIFPDKLFPELCIKHLKSFLPDQEAENRQEQEKLQITGDNDEFHD